MGKLNLLHHKSWHVYSAKNRERVARDEAKAKAAEEEKEERAAVAEGEARLERLRGRTVPTAMDGRHATDEGTLTDAQGHIELFAPVTQEPSADGTDKPKKKTNKKDETPSSEGAWKLGETMDGSKATPWYAAKDVRAASEALPTSSFLLSARGPLTLEERRAKDALLKAREDPLAKMPQSSSGSLPSSSKVAPLNPTTDKPLSKIEQLRAERLKREEKERARAREAQGLAVPIVPATFKTHASDSGFYHSQFNPEAARGRKRKDEMEGREKRPWHTSSLSSGSRRFGPY